MTFTGTEFTTQGLLGEDTVDSVSLVSAGAAATATVALSPYAIVASNAQGIGLEDYSIVYADGSLTVTPRPLTVTATGVNKVYDDSTAATVILSDNALSGDSVTASYTTASFADQNVGTAKSVFVSGISIGGADASNYSLQNLTAITTADIMPTGLTVTATAANKVYNGTTVATVTLSSDASSGQNVILSYTTAAFADKNVGAGKTVVVSGISISGADAGNYTLRNTSTTTTADITTKALTGSITADNKEYDETTAATIATRTLTGAVPGDAVAYTSGTASFASFNVGNNIPVTATGLTLAGADAANYTVNSSASTTADIVLRTLTITADSIPKVYGQTVTFTGTEFTTQGLLGEDTVESVSLASAGAAATATVALSPYAIVASNAQGSGLDDYSLVYVDGSLAVTPVTLTVNGVTATNKDYDATVTAGIVTTGASLNGVIGSDEVTLDSTGKTGSFSNKNVGDAKTVTVSGLGLAGADAGNYTLTQPMTSANITPAVLVGSITANDKEYDGTTTATIATRTLAGVYAGDVVSYVGGTADFDTAAVGVNKLVTATGLGLNGLDAGNYMVNTIATTTAEITSLHVLIITADSTTKFYGQTVIFTGTEFTTQGLLPGDSVTSVTLVSEGAAATAAVGASPYTIVASDATGVGLEAYKIDYATGNLTVQATGLTVTGVTAANKVYDATDTAEIATTSAELSGLIGSDQVTLVTTDAAGTFDDKDVGNDKLVTVSGLTISGDDAANYILTQPTTRANVTPAGLTVTGVTADNKVYDANLIAVINTSSSALSGVLDHDAVMLDTAGSTGSFGDKNVGGGKAVTIAGLTISGDDAANYTLTQPTSTANITPAALTVTATGVNKVYDATTAASVSLSDNHLSSDIVTSSYSVAGFSDQNVGTAKSVFVGGIAIGGASAHNYSLQDTSTTTTADITAKALTGSITADNKEYDETTAATIATRSLSGVVPGDTVNYVGGTASFASFNVGTNIAVTATGLTLAGADAANYTVNSSASTTADILLRTLTITPSDSTKVYGQTVTFTGTEFTTQGLLGEDTVDSVSLVSAGAAATATVALSPYAIVASDAQGIGLEDYSLVYADGSLTVTPRPLTVTATGVNKVYDDSTAATVILSDNALSGDSVTASYTTASFADQNVGTAKSVFVSGISIGGADASNYSLQNLTATTTADITPTGLTISATGVNKVYNATTVASVNLADNHLGSDVVILSYTTATFADKNVGAGKTVVVSGISISGADADNYTLRNTSTTTTADITTKALAGSITADNKEYDETTAATIATRSLSGVVPGDTVNYVGGTASFASFNVGTNIAVTATGLTLAGADAANYTVNSSASTTADILLRTLTITPSDSTKVYGQTVTFTGTEFTTQGLLGEDTVDSVSLVSAGAAATATVALSPYAIVASDAQGIGLEDYSIVYADGTLAVTPRELVVTATADNKVYDGSTEAPVTLSNNHLSGDIVTVSYATASFFNTSVANDKIVTIGGLTINGPDAENYMLASTTISATANISARPVTVTALAESKKFGEPDPPLAYQTTSGSVVSGDSFSGSLTRAPGETVGVYPIEIGTLTLGTNYTLSFVGANFTILGFTTGSIDTTSAQTYYGQEVTFTATFTAPTFDLAPMTGSVAFFDGNTYLGTSKLVATNSAMLTVASPTGTLPFIESGQANLATLTLNVGNHVIRAEYSGDANYVAATSATPVNVNVIAATTSMSLSTVTSPLGTTLNATVWVTSPGTPTIVGSVAFYDNGMWLGNVPVVNNSASLSIPPLSSGQHSLSAVFSEEGNFSTSVLTVTVTMDGPQVVGVTRYGPKTGSNELVLTFNSPLDPATAQDVRCYSIIGIGCNKVIPIRSELYNPATRTVTLTLGLNLWRFKSYRLTVYGKGVHVVTGSNGLALDGTGTGKPSNFVTKLTKSTPWKPGKAPALQASVTNTPDHHSSVKPAVKTVVRTARAVIATIRSRRIGK